MNDQDYIKLFIEKGAKQSHRYCIESRPAQLIAFAKDVEAQVLRELLARAGSWIDLDRTVKQMIAERRG